MKLPLENDKGYVLIDDTTSKILSVVVHNAIPNKRDFINLASYVNNPDGTQSLTRICNNHFNPK
jgi:hypothetical protein